METCRFSCTTHAPSTSYKRKDLNSAYQDRSRGRAYKKESLVQSYRPEPVGVGCSCAINKGDRSPPYCRGRGWQPCCAPSSGPYSAPRRTLVQHPVPWGHR